MTVSIRTLCRLALVAAAVAFGSPAYAGTATIDCGAGSPSWNSSTNTLSCGSGTKCSISGPSSVVVNNSFTLTASCPSGSTYTWVGTGGASSCSGATCDVTEASTGNKTYTVATETAGSLSNNFVVSITSGAVAPSGCSLTANPSSGPSGTNVGLTANCTSGTSPINITWGSASGTSGCPTSFNVGSPATCTVNNVTANATWQASFSNTAGGAGNNPRSAAFTVQSGGGGGNFAGCPSGTVTIDGVWGNTSIDTAEFGGFVDNILSIRVAPPSTATGSSTRTSAWVEFGASGTVREAVFSTQACDFSSTNALKSSLGAPFMSSNQNGVTFKYTITGSSSFTVAKLTPGQSYYINIRNRYPSGANSCTQADCRMRGGVPQ